MLISTLKASISFPVRRAFLHSSSCRTCAPTFALPSRVRFVATRPSASSARSCTYATSDLDITSMPESVVEGLQPQALWRFFYALTQLPRPSKCEEKYACLHVQGTLSPANCAAADMHNMRHLEHAGKMSAAVVAMQAFLSWYIDPCDNLQGHCIFARLCRQASAVMQARQHRQYGHQQVGYWRW